MHVNEPIRDLNEVQTGALLSVVTPAYNESKNLPLLYQRITNVLDPLGFQWEWIVVDDHSTDGTFVVVDDIARIDHRVRCVRFSRNSGSHAAIICGLEHSRGNCGVILAADLQDPPEILPELLQKWQQGAQVVWAVRENREGEKASTLRFSRAYYSLMRRVIGIREMPSSGADFFLADRRVIDALSRFGESNASILALITWMGFRQTSINYTKQARVHGKSGWSIGKKVKLVIDSVTSFSYLPIRIMTYLGFVVAMLGFLYAIVVIISSLRGGSVAGWSSLMVVVLAVGGIQMLMMGVLGEYLWRALDESRQRPRYLIEDMTPPSIQPGLRQPLDADNIRLTVEKPVGARHES